MPTPPPSLATRAATVKVFESLGRKQHDQRSAEQFEADLVYEAELSLRAHPERLPWTDSQYRKRAVPPERTANAERAVLGEDTENRERAVPSEGTANRERAIQRESTKSHERAKECEGTGKGE